MSVQTKRQAKAIERRLEVLTGRSVILMERIHKLELTLSRIKNETQEIIGNQLTGAKDGD